MKKVVFLLLTICHLSAISQPCSVAISNNNFNAIKNQILSAATTTLALQKGREVAQYNCFTSNQARDIILLFLQDLHKTEIAKTIYPNVNDRHNFSVVYDAYTNAPALASLARYVSEYDMQQTTGTNTGFDRVNIILPDFEKYAGYKITNQLPLSNSSFAQLISNIDNPSPQIRLRNALNIDPSKYFSVAQVMEIAMLFQQENMRLNVLQNYVPQIVDTYNYSFALQLLSSFSNKYSFLQTAYSYLENNGSGNNQNTDIISCKNPITDAEATTIKNSLEKIKLSSTKSKQYKVIVKSKCLTTTQIKMLVLLFNNKDRLDLLKYSYDYCSDLKNYYKLSDALVYNTEIDSFSSFLENK